MGSLDAALNRLEELEFCEDAPKGYSSHSAFPALVRVAKYASWLQDLLDEDPNAVVCSSLPAAQVLVLMLIALVELEDVLPMVPASSVQN